MSDSTLSTERQLREMAAVEAFVRSSPWATRLHPETLGTLLASISTRTLAPGDVLCVQGDVPQCWFGIMDGLLRQDVFTREGERISLAAGRIGTWLGEAALVLGEPRSYEISALRESKVACIGASAFFRALQGDPEFNRAVLRLISQRMQYFMELYLIQRGASPDERVARVLRSLVGETAHGPHLHLAITQDELAQVAGISRQRAHKALHDMQERGIVDISYGAITLVQPERLKFS